MQGNEYLLGFRIYEKHQRFSYESIKNRFVRRKRKKIHQSFFSHLSNSAFLNQMHILFPQTNGKIIRNELKEQPIMFLSEWNCIVYFHSDEQLRWFTEWNALFTFLPRYDSKMKYSNEIPFNRYLSKNSITWRHNILLLILITH